MAKLATFCVNIDVKPPHPQAAHAVIEAVRRQGAEDRVLLTSFSDRVIRAIRAAVPDVGLESFVRDKSSPDGHVHPRLRRSR